MFNQLEGPSPRQRGCGECWVCRALTAAGGVWETRPGPGLPQSYSGWQEQQTLPNPCSSLSRLCAPPNTQEGTPAGLHLARDMCSSVSSWCSEIVVAREHVAWLTGHAEPCLAVPAGQSRQGMVAGGIRVVGVKLKSLMKSVVCLGHQRVTSLMSLWPAKSGRPRDCL